MSADGRFVVFDSDATNLTAASDTNGKTDVFEHDLATGRTIRVSKSTAGAQGDGRSLVDGVSADGRFVLFTSYASKLVAGDTNHRPDAFLRDVAAGTTIRVDVTSRGRQRRYGVLDARASGQGSAALAPGGRYVEFGDPIFGVFVRDLRRQTTHLVSVARNGKPFASTLTCGICVGFAAGAISEGGRFAAFAGDPAEGFPEKAWVRDRVARTTTRVDVGSPLLVDNSRPTAITPDGRFVVFINESSSTDDARVFVRDLRSAVTTLVGHYLTGDAPNLFGPSGLISDDGGRVSFVSGDAGIVPGDANGVFDAFLRDLTAGTTTRVSVSSTGAQLAQASQSAFVSPDGRFVVFSTNSAAVAADTNRTTDVYVGGPFS
jgi:Tol biopolymer transport system component